MEEIEKNIAKILPALSLSVITNVCKCLSSDLGIETTDDPKFVKEDDLMMLKPIQARTLIERW